MSREEAQQNEISRWWYKMQRGDTTLMLISGSKPTSSFDKVGNIT